jgi:3'-phosphoadenosine 5'-phosphosulfate sulfotransferase (PAPS reductase)/FAD synthetase
MPTQNELTMLQHLPLEVKVAKTQQRIREWVNFYGKDGVYVSFSGGKDSTVLLHLVRGLYGNDIPAVFVDTGLEYPEIRQFVKTFENVEILKPKMGFVDVITKYGYPIIGKEVAERIEGVKKCINSNGEKYVEFYYQIYGDKLSKRYDFSKWKPLLDVDFNISPKCCSVMKKTPANIYAKITGRNSITGVMAEESRLRKTNWLKTGCNAFDSKVPMSNPMAFWKNQDVLQYIKENKIPICSVYGDIVSVDTDKNQYENSLVGSKLRTTGCQRTGCIFCAFGAHSRGDRRFLDLKITHPKQYAYCMNGGEFVDGIWKPNKQGLGMSHVFDEVNKIYGKDFIKYV